MITETKGVYGMNYAELTSVLVKAIQELESRVEVLEIENEKLRLGKASAMK